MRPASLARPLALAALALPLLAAPARAQDGTQGASGTAPVTTVVPARDGSGVLVQSDVREPKLSAALDVVFLSDGYPADEASSFFADAKAMAQHVDQDGSAAPMRALRKFNFHSVFVPSVDRGAPWRTPTPGNTPFKTFALDQVMLRCDTAAADAAAAKYAPDVDLVVVIARFADGAPSGEYSMRANSDIKGQGSRVRIPRDAPGAFVHELGHALYALGDEYGGREQAMSPADRAQAGIFPNLTYEPTGAKWASVYHGAVEGGDEWNHGIWHPTPSCRMNQCWDPAQAFCPVCIATMGALPTAAPGTPAIASNPGRQASGEVLATIQPGSGGQPWNYYVSVHSSSGSGPEVLWERVEPQLGPAGQISLGNLPAGDYMLWVEAESPAGRSSWATRTFTVGKPTPPPPPPPPPPPAGDPSTPPVTNPTTTAGVQLEPERHAPAPHGIPFKPVEGPRAGIVQALGGL